MLDETLMTLAEISATFLAVVFAGFSFFLENLRHAGDQVKEIIPSAIEATTSVVYVMIGYSLSIYGIALLLPLAGLAAEQHFTYATLGFSGLIVMMWLSMEAFLRRRFVASQIRKLREARLSIWYWTQIRIWFVRILFPMAAFFLFLYFYKPNLFGEKVLLEIHFCGTVTYIIAGTVFSIVDLAVFRARNVLFLWDSVDDFFRMIVEDIHAKIEEATKTYNEFKAEVEKRSLSHASLIRPFKQSVDQQYHKLLEASRSIDLSSQFQEKGMASAEEIIGYYLGYRTLLGGINHFLARVRNAQEEIKALYSKR